MMEAIGITRGAAIAINDLLDISRIESGKMLMKQEPLDLQEVVEKVLDLLSVQAKEKRIELITRSPAEETITQEELRNLLETNKHPIAYNGWEPSGMVHLGTGLLCAYKIKDLIEAGIKFKIYLATWHAWINNKLGGDMKLIKKAAEHFKHAWISLALVSVVVIFSCLRRSVTKLR
jgi:hypothetical protein